MLLEPLLIFLLAAHPAELSAEGADALFHHIQRLSRRDGGKLWKTELHGPVIVLDGITGTAWANHPIEGWTHWTNRSWRGQLKPGQDGPLIHDYANRWALLRHPLPQDERERDRQIVRALFRRLEPDLGLPANRPAAKHLESEEGLRWLRFEAQALQSALDTGKRIRREALIDALVFRAWRRSHHPEAANEERVLELNEGLAEYTALIVTLRKRAERTAWVQRALRSLNPSTYAISVAPAYGLLLDEKGERWRDSVNSQADLGLILKDQYELGTPLVSGEEAGRRAQRYSTSTGAAP